jgi:hypothetical protein
MVLKTRDKALGSMSESIYDDLPEDHEQAFVYLEKKFRAELDDSLKDNDQGQYDSYCKRKYMNKVIAAAKSLDIIGIKDYSTPIDNNAIWETFDLFETDVMNLSIQIEINNARKRRNYSVMLEGAEKVKIRHYISQIRSLIDNSALSANKRDAIFKKLSELTLEIDRDRTRFEIVADATRSMARLSGDVEREGAEPWWKWVKLIFGVIDEAKEHEPQQSLPAPEERRRLEAPRKQLPLRSTNLDAGTVDDDIPF